MTNQNIETCHNLISSFKESQKEEEDELNFVGFLRSKQTVDGCYCSFLSHASKYTSLNAKLHFTMAAPAEAWLFWYHHYI